MENEGTSEPVVGKVFQKDSLLFPVIEATTRVPSDQIPQGHASAPKSIAKLALVPVVVGIEDQTKIRLLSLSATKSFPVAVTIASLGQLH
jgi:hypothetical protein